jgi:hypothetical protein
VIRVYDEAGHIIETYEHAGDGKPDYLLYRASTRQTAIWYLNNNVYLSAAFGPTLFGPLELSSALSDSPPRLIYLLQDRSNGIPYKP